MQVRLLSRLRFGSLKVKHPPEKRDKGEHYPHEAQGVGQSLEMRGRSALTVLSYTLGNEAIHGRS